MIDGSVTNKGRQTARAVIVSGVLFSPFSPRTLALLYFRVPPKKERLSAG